jgi:hypothetical protein
MPEAEPPEGVVDRRQRGDDAQAALELGLKLSERDVGRRRDQPLERTLVRREVRAPMPAVARRRRAAGRAHPLHQLDRGRRPDREAPGRGADRAAALDRAHDPQPQVHGHRCRHHYTSAVSTVIVESQAPIPRNRKML